MCVVLENSLTSGNGAATDAGVQRAQQHLKTSIQQAFTPASFNREKCYTLKANLTLDKTNVDTQPNGIITRQRFMMRAVFSLYDRENKYLFTSTSRAVSSYNLVPQEYSNFVAEESLKERLTETLARDVSVQLASFFNAKKAVKQSETHRP